MILLDDFPIKNAWGQKQLQLLSAWTDIWQEFSHSHNSITGGRCGVFFPDGSRCSGEVDFYA